MKDLYSITFNLYFIFYQHKKELITKLFKLRTVFFGFYLFFIFIIIILKINRLNIFILKFLQNIFNIIF